MPTLAVSATLLWSAVPVLAGEPSQIDSAPAPFSGTVDTFGGFARHRFDLRGSPCFVVVPKEAAPGRPWIWRARFFGHEPQVDIALLGRGYHVAYVDVAGLFGAPEAVARWDRFYDLLTTRHGLSARPLLEGMSRGGLIVLNWAIAHPDRVAAIYLDAPVCDIRSWPGGKGRSPGSEKDWRLCLAAYGLTEEQSETAEVSPLDRLAPLAKARVPILSVCGDADDVVPLEENSGILRARYEGMGGPIRLILKPGVGHHPHSLEDPAPIVEFLLKAAGDPRP